MKVLYTTEAVVEGGRAGHGRTSDGRLASLSVPKIGGDGGPGTIQRSSSRRVRRCFQSSLLSVPGSEARCFDSTVNRPRWGSVPPGHGGWGCGRPRPTRTEVVSVDAEDLMRRAHAALALLNATRGPHRRHRWRVDGTTVERSAAVKSMTVISVIVGSTRKGRFSEKARALDSAALKKPLASTRGYSICATSDAIFRSAVTPATLGRPASSTRSFSDGPPRIAQSDGFVVSPRNTTTDPRRCSRMRSTGCNPEWNRKAVGFVSYGSAMGARSVQQLRDNGDRALQLAPIRSSVPHHRPGALLSASRYDVRTPTWATAGGRQGDVDR